MPDGGDVERLLGWFDAGTLHRPVATRPNTVALARALMSLVGAPDITTDGVTKTIADAIGNHEHYVFVMCDGIGMNLIETLPPDSFLRSHLSMEIQSVFPSSTAPALTSIATTHWPARHAVPTWWTYLPDVDVTTTILKYVERYSERPLGEFGIDRDAVFPAPSIFGRIDADAMAFTPSYIADSVTTSYLYSDTPVVGYERLGDATGAIALRVSSATQSTYSTLYIPYVDAAEHEHGVFSPQARRALDQVDRSLEKLAAALAGRARLVITADHGLIDVAHDAKRVITDDSALMRHLVCPPAGEPRVPVFHVRPGHADEFVAEFRGEYGADWALVNTDDAHKLGLLGPDPFDAVARPRFGDFIAIAGGARELVYAAEPEGLRGSHGGLTLAEMRIPLVLS